MSTSANIYAPQLIGCIKAILLIINAFCTYQGMTPPATKPSAAEQTRFEKPTYLARTIGIFLIVSLISKATLGAVALSEAVVTLAQQFPYPIAERVASTLLPSTAPPLMDIHISTFVTILCCLMGIAGGLIRIACHHALGDMFTWQVSIRDNHKLVTTGPYAFVRHPSYTGWVLIVTGNVLLLVTPGTYAVRNTAMGVENGSEDAVLKKEFRKQWLEWEKATPCKLIPYVY